MESGKDIVKATAKARAVDRVNHPAPHLAARAPLPAERRRSATGRELALKRSEKSPSWSPAMANTQ